MKMYQIQSQKPFSTMCIIQTKANSENVLKTKRYRQNLALTPHKIIERFLVIL